MLPTVVPSVMEAPSRPTGIVPYGLFSVAPVLPLSRNVAVEWENRVCVDMHATVSECFGGPSDSDVKDLTGRQHWQVALPFSGYAATDCPPGDDDESRVRDKVVASEQFLVEEFFYTNVLSDSPVGVGNALGRRQSLGRMEQELAERYGVPGVIHMSREMFTILDPDSTTVGGVLRTELGTAIVAGSGYPYLTTIYGTGPVRVFRSDTAVSHALGYETNQDFFLAERNYVVAADLCDAVIAVTGIVIT